MTKLNASLDEQIFSALQIYEQIKYQNLNVDVTSQVESPRSRRLSFSDIVNCVKSPNTPLSTAALATINQSIDYRRKYRFVLGQMSRLQSPKQIAASSALIMLERREEEFELNISEHGHKGFLVQLSLQQGDKVENTAAFLHCECEENIEVLTLQADGSGLFVSAVNHDDTRLSALTNVNSHIYVTF